MTMPFQLNLNQRFGRRKPTPAPAAAAPREPFSYSSPYTGLGNRAKQQYGKQQYADIGQRADRSGDLYSLYGSALVDPAAQGRKFQSFFDEAAGGIAAPAMRDFNQQLATVGANTAARFGGNASSEEQRNVYNTSDLFSRNLSEALARLAPQAAQMGQNYTSELGTAARGATSELDQALAGFDPTKLKKGGGLGKVLGAGLGIAANAFLPGAGAAFIPAITGGR